MKLIIFSIIVLLLASGCQEKNSYVLNGSFNGEPNEDWIYMVKFLDSYENRDSAKIENGKFIFKGTIEVPEVYAFHFRMDRITGIASGFIEPGNLHLEIDLENWDMNSKVTGGKFNDEHNRLQAEKIEKFMKNVWALDQNLQTASPDESKYIIDSIENILDACRSFEKDYVGNNFDSPVALYILFREQFSYSTEEKGLVLSMFDESLHNTTIYKSILSDYENEVQINNQPETVPPIVKGQLINMN
jgi:hypothetical protein